MKRLLLKIIPAWLLYVLLHFMNKIFSGFIITLIGCPEESIFQHMKMAFVSYLIVSIVEYFIIRKSQNLSSGHIWSRLLSLAVCRVDKPS